MAIKGTNFIIRGLNSENLMYSIRCIIYLQLYTRNYLTYLKIAKRLNLEYSHHTKKGLVLCDMMEVLAKCYGANHFTISENQINT